MASPSKSSSEVAKTVEVINDFDLNLLNSETYHDIEKDKVVVVDFETLLQDYENTRAGNAPSRNFVNNDGGVKNGNDEQTRIIQTSNCQTMIIKPVGNYAYRYLHFSLVFSKSTIKSNTT